MIFRFQFTNMGVFIHHHGPYSFRPEIKHLGPGSLVRMGCHICNFNLCKLNFSCECECRRTNGVIKNLIKFDVFFFLRESQYRSCKTKMISVSYCDNCTRIIPANLKKFLPITNLSNKKSGNAKKSHFQILNRIKICH